MPTSDLVARTTSRAPTTPDTCSTTPTKRYASRTSPLTAMYISGLRHGCGPAQPSLLVLEHFTDSQTSVSLPRFFAKSSVLRPEGQTWNVRKAIIEKHSGSGNHTPGRGLGGRPRPRFEFQDRRGRRFRHTNVPTRGQTRTGKTRREAARNSSSSCRFNARSNVASLARKRAKATRADKTVL